MHAKKVSSSCRELYRLASHGSRCSEHLERLKLPVSAIQVVPAEYAFVVHTANPLTGQRGEIFGEVVVGMGDALVGNFPGRALSFTVPQVVVLKLDIDKEMSM